MIKKALLFTIASLVLSSSVFAETFYLKDKSVIMGRILNYNEGKFVIARQTGGKQIIGRDQVAKIEFSAVKEGDDSDKKKSEKSDADAPQPHFASPIQTFLFWKKSAEKGRTNSMADCFVSFAREDQLAQLKSFSKKQIKRMRKDTKKTDFNLGEPLFDGDKAYLSVNRRKGKNSQTSIIQFQKEGENWKMIPD